MKLDPNRLRVVGSTPEQTAKNSKPLLTCVARCLANVAPVPISWLWFNRLALGKLNLIAGQPGLGKSQFTALMAAHVTTGKLWPDGSQCPEGSVIFISCEDDAADTVVPRLMAAGADCSRVYILDWIAEAQPDGTAHNRSFVIGSDVRLLAELAAKVGDVRLVVIDPVSAYMGNADSHKTSDVRASLAPLQTLAGEIGACVVLISHLNKGSADGAAISRVAGSGAYVAACRSAWFVAKHPSDEARRVFTPLKNNVGDDKTGYAYAIEGVTLDSGIRTSRVTIDPTPIRITPEEALAAAGDDGEDASGAVADAASFLRAEIDDAGRLVTDLKSAAKDAGIAWRTIERAKKVVGIMAQKDGYTGGWRYFIAPPKTANDYEGRQDRHAPKDGGLGGVGSDEAQQRQHRHEFTSGKIGGLGGLAENLAAFDGIEEGRL